MNFFKQIDFISIEPKLFVNKMSRYKNLWGSFFSLLILILTLIAALYLISDLFARKKQKIINNEDVNENSFINLTNFPFMFNVLDNYGKKFENPDKIYKITPIIWKMNYEKIDIKGNVETEIVNLDFKKCDKFNDTLLFSEL